MESKCWIIKPLTRAFSPASRDVSGGESTEKNAVRSDCDIGKMNADIFILEIPISRSNIRR